MLVKKHLMLTNGFQMIFPLLWKCNRLIPSIFWLHTFWRISSFFFKEQKALTIFNKWGRGTIINIIFGWTVSMTQGLWKNCVENPVVHNPLDTLYIVLYIYILSINTRLINHVIMSISVMRQCFFSSLLSISFTFFIFNYMCHEQSKDNEITNLTFKQAIMHFNAYIFMVIPLKSIMH